MKVALVNPAWDFRNSIYFGCRDPHLPLELGSARVLLEQAGHEAEIFDGAFCQLDNRALVEAVADYAPDMTVVTTAPTYLFWRCAPPELRCPRDCLEVLGARGGRTIAVGPHGSATPAAALTKLGADIIIRGECEEAIVELADCADLSSVPGIAYRRGDSITVTGPPRATRFTDLPPLRWPDSWIHRHHHHHHRFGTEILGPGAEVEASRGCPYSCSFCAKIDFRDSYRKRNLHVLLEEVDALLSQGVTYLYFIDEIFLPQRPLLEALAARKLQFGIQTRIDLWKPDMLALLGRAGCVSIEAGVESLTREGRAALDKNCRMTTDDLAERLVLARRYVPFVQANLIKVAGDESGLVAAWRDQLQSGGVWANDPVPLFAYPSSPDYLKRFGDPDDRAWERAHADYLTNFPRLSDIQDDTPLPLDLLEARCCSA